MTTDKTRDELFAEYFEDREGSAQVAEHAYNRGWKDRSTYTVVPDDKSHVRPVAIDDDQYERMEIAQKMFETVLAESALLPVDPKALAASIAEIDGHCFEDVPTVSQSESIMLILHELKRLLATRDAAPSDAPIVASVRVNLTCRGGVSEVSEPIFEMTSEFEALVDANPGKEFWLWARKEES